MLTLTSDLTSGFELNFRYARGEDNHPQAVQAVLTIVKGGEECVYKQWAHCHPNDNFSKQYGRKLALTRLLKQYAYEIYNYHNFSKDDVKQMWKVALPKLVS